MKIEIVNENLVEIRKSKDYELQINDGEIITINKWIVECDREVDNDWNIINGKDIYDKLDDDMQIEIDDFVMDININD